MAGNRSAISLRPRRLNARVEKVIETDADQHCRCDAVQQAAHMLIHSQQIGEPRFWKLQGKAGQHQYEETGEQGRVLPAIAARHARDKIVLGLAQLDGLPAPQDEVVRQHAAVNRILERPGTYVEADRFAVDVMSEAGIAVAGEAIFRGGLGRLFSLPRALYRRRTVCGKEGESNSERKNRSCPLP